MRYLVRGAFEQPLQAQEALESLLRAGFRQDQVAFRSRLADAGQEQFTLEGYDPIAGARISGRITAALSTTGYNLFGNSTLADTNLGDIGPLLADVAETEDDEDVEENDGTFTLRIDALVRTYDRYRAELAQDVLDQAGAHQVRIVRGDGS